MSDGSEVTTDAPPETTDDLDLGDDGFDSPEEITELETAEAVEEPYGPLAALDALVNSYIQHPGDLKRLPHIGSIVTSFTNNRQNIVNDIARIRTRERELERAELTNTYTVD